MPEYDIHARYPWRTEEGIRFPGTGATYMVMSYYVGSLVTLEEQPVPLTIDPSLLHLRAILIMMLNQFMGFYFMTHSFSRDHTPLTIVLDWTTMINI